MNIFDNFNFLTGIIVPLLVALVPGIFSAWEFLHQAKAELEKEYSKKFNDKKWEVYTQFAELVRDMFSDNPIDATELAKREISLASQIVLIGSDDVVTIFHDWREARSVYGQSHSSAKEKLFQLIATMRKDLGNKFTQLDMETLLGSLEPDKAMES